MFATYRDFKNTTLNLRPYHSPAVHGYRTHFKNTILDLRPDIHLLRRDVDLFQEYYIRFETRIHCSAMCSHIDFKNTILDLRLSYRPSPLCNSSGFQEYYIRFETYHSPAVHGYRNHFKNTILDLRQRRRRWISAISLNFKNTILDLRPRIAAIMTPMIVYFKNTILDLRRHSSIE